MSLNILTLHTYHDKIFIIFFFSYFTRAFVSQFYYKIELSLCVAAMFFFVVDKVIREGKTGPSEPIKKKQINKLN